MSRRERHTARPARTRIATIVAAVAASGALAGAAAAPSPAATSTNAGVVEITTSAGGGQGAGMGFVWRASGVMLTNNHVIRGARSIRVTVPATRRRYAADVVGYDVTRDVAVLRTPVTSSSRLTSVLLRYKPGARVSVTYVTTAGQRRSTVVRLGSGPPQ